MSTLLAIYAAIIFIAAVIVFTIGEINKNAEEEPETYKWMRIFSFILLVLAATCAIASRYKG